MNLIISRPDVQFTSKFGELMINSMKRAIYRNLTSRQLDVFQEYIVSNLNGNISIKTIILRGMNALKYRLIDDHTIEFYIDSRIHLPELEDIKLITICKLIDFGNADLKPFPLFSKVFKDVNKNIDTYIFMYM